MRFRDDMITELVDLLDETVMQYYDAKKQEGKTLYYFDALTSILEAINSSKELLIRDKKTKTEVEILIKEIRTKNYFFEEKRKALLLLEIKGLKHLNYPLDVITPDTICVIIASLVQSLIENQEHINIIDPNYGLGNLALIVNEIVQVPINWYGIENHERFVNYVRAKTNYLSSELTLYDEDALKQDYPKIDLVISDIAVYDYDNDEYESELTKAKITYFPYLLIEKNLNVGDEKTKYLYLVNNDFFKQKGSVFFQKMVDAKGQIAALIMLPLDFFQDDNKGKSFIILNKNPKVRETILFMLPSLDNDEAILTTMKEIKTFLRSI